MYFQDVISKLNKYWASAGCIITQPYDIEKGAGTFNPATFFNCLMKKPIAVAFVEPCRRPTDGRYGENPNRLQHYYQYQVIIKPSPAKIQKGISRPEDSGLRLKHTLVFCGKAKLAMRTPAGGLRPLGI